MEAAYAAPLVVAEHWALGRRPRPGRAALLGAADALRRSRLPGRGPTTRRALELCSRRATSRPAPGRLEALAGCTELAGDLVEAATTWREVADGRRREWAIRPASRRGLRRLAGALSSRAAGRRRWPAGEQAVAFTAAGLEAEAAAERLASPPTSGRRPASAA